MIYKDFKGIQLSALGFGTMRLPLIPGGNAGDIDQKQVDEMVDYAIANGVNYFDTAYVYHDGLSEASIGKALNRYPREKWYIADKYPGHQVLGTPGLYLPDRVFEQQLERCGVEYFDFYLLHNVNENSIKVYENEANHVREYFLEQKRSGRIKHLGFSCHGDEKIIARMNEIYGGELEFCQIQLNYLDWTLQNAKAKVEYLNSIGMPIWVMEPVRGGKLASFDENYNQRLKALRPDESIPAWAFRWLETLPQPTMVLSGMSNMEQMVDNVKTFSNPKPLNEEEMTLLMEVASDFGKLVPCTACRYCCPGCPKGLDIPTLIGLANDARLSKSINIPLLYEGIPTERNASACIGCGKCAGICPQGINVPEVMKELVQAIERLPKWAEICREREKNYKAQM